MKNMRIGIDILNNKCYNIYNYKKECTKHEQQG